MLTHRKSLELSAFLVCLLSQSILTLEEESEQVFELAEGYRSNNPPVKDGEPVVAELRIVIYQIAEISEIHMNMKLNLYFALRWKDCYVSTKEKIVGLRKDQYAKLWKPYVDVLNMEYMTPKVGLREMIYFFVSKDQSVRYFFGVILLLPCPFHFQSYPFDIQVCDVNITMRVYRSELALLQWASEKPVRFDSYSGETSQDLPKYSISVCALKKEAFYSALTGNFSRLIVRFIMRRDLNNYILSIYLPSTIFVMVSWCSFLVSPSVVPGRIVLIVTTLLTLITMYGSSIQTAPPSVKVQSLNIWLLGCIVFVFAALVEYSVVLFRVRDNIQKQSSGLHQIRLLEINHVSLYPKQEVEEDTFTEKIYRRCRRLSSSLSKYINNPGWNRLDRISMVLFPSMFFFYSSGYWSLFLNRREDSIPEDECV